MQLALGGVAWKDPNLESAKLDYPTITRLIDMTRSSPIDQNTAAFLSFLLPGWGQMRRGKTAQGLIWMVVVIAGYLLMVVPGVILHILCMLEAYWRE